MNLDARRSPRYQEPRGWKMPNPQPTGTLKRPPVLKNGSSSSSLASLEGMEKTIPPFQNSVRRTPPGDSLKPLPPTPLVPRRRASWADSSATQSLCNSRRSSSVYSTTLSQWDANEAADRPPVPALPSWGSIDFADHPNIFLQPIAFSASTPQLADNQRLSLVHETREFEPLITKPSPTISRASSPSPPPDPRPSVLLPPPPSIIQVAKQHLLTVSLEKAKEAINAPGTVRFLPEELRAQKPLHLPRSRSHEPIRKSSLEIFSPLLPTQCAMLVDNQGRDRLLHSPNKPLSQTPRTSYTLSLWTPTERHVSDASTTPMSSYTLPPWTPTKSKDSSGSFEVETGLGKDIVPLTTRMSFKSKTKIAQSLGFADRGEPRGRTMHRGPRNMSYEHHLPKSMKVDLSMDEATDAEALAKEYHTLLTEQYRQPSDSPSQGNTKSDDMVGEVMKMVPKPLFHTKPALIPSAVQPELVDSSVSGLRYVESDVAGSRKSGSSSCTVFPGLCEERGHHRGSTSGSIPISPPSLITSTVSSVEDEPCNSFRSEQRPQVQRSLTKARAGGVQEHTASAYYPHVMPRKSSKKNWKAKADNSCSPTSRGSPPLPSSGANVFVQKPKASDGMLGTSPVRTAFRSEGGGTNDLDSLDLDEGSGKPIQWRTFEGSVTYTDNLTLPSASLGRKSEDESVSPSRVVRLASPHLHPSPSSGKAPATLHLGWSDASKSNFDQARSPIQTHNHAGQRETEHIAAPARALNETKSALKETEAPLRKGSIFGGMMDSWREGKQTKRREELKKTIKVVTPTVTVDKEERSSKTRQSMLERRLSTFGWS